MSFSSDTKEELIQMPLEKACCITHELGAITHTSASLSLQGGGRFRLSYQVESSPLARRIFSLLRQGFSITPSLHFVQHPRFKNKKTTVLTLENEDALTLLPQFDMLEIKEDGRFQLSRIAPKQSPTKRCCRNAFLRGAFLGAGTITNPEKGYHLEIRTPKASFYKNLKDVMGKAGFAPKTALRKGSHLIYLKSGNDIVAFLAATEAHKALMKMEEIRVQKEVLNQVNRSMNCDHYNLDKQLSAAQKQVAAIGFLQEQNLFSALNEPLRQTFRLRLENPEASLENLGNLLTPPVGKSGVNHRLTKIIALAESHGLQKEDFHDS